MHCKRLMTLILFMIFSGQIICQDNTDENDWINILTNYRNQLVENNLNEVSRLKILFENWKAVGISADERERLTLNLIKYGKIDEYSFEELKKNFNKHLASLKIEINFKQDDLDLILRNVELLNLVLLGVLDAEYPFPVDISDNLKLELSAYEIDKLKKVGEIGSGFGQFSLLMHLINPDIKQYVNEIDESFLNYQKKLIAANIKYFDLNSFTFVEGNKKSTNLEGQELDILLIRNSFHHFSKKKKMIASIKKSIKRDGKIFVLESVPELDANNNVCSKAISKNKLRKFWLENGLKLIKETLIGEQLLIELMVVD